MTSQFLKDTITRDCQEYDLIVLKGFSPTLLLELRGEFTLLDDYCIENKKIILENINEHRLMLSLISYNAEKKAI